MTAPRVAVTTAADRASLVASFVVEAGLTPVLLPCIAIQPEPARHLQRMRRLAGDADRIMLTSPRAVSALWPDGGMPQVSVHAVGETSAEAASSAGGDVVQVGTAGLAQLAASMSREVTGDRIFFPHARGLPLSGLRPVQAVATVISREVYSTLRLAPGSQPVEAVIFASPSAVAAWDAVRSLDGLIVSAIGETTARALSGIGHEPDVVPSRPDYRELVSRLAEHLSDRSTA